MSTSFGCCCGVLRVDYYIYWRWPAVREMMPALLLFSVWGVFVRIAPMTLRIFVRFVYICVCTTGSRV